MRRTVLRRGWRATSMVVAIAVSLLVTTLPAARAGEVLPFSLAGVIRQRCGVNGVGPADTTVTIRHRRADGSSKGQVQVQIDEFGAWGPVCLQKAIAARDRLVVRQGTQVLRRISVPKLTATVDRVKDRVAGTAPAGASLMVQVGPCPPLFNGGCSNQAQKAVTANASGAWRWNLSGTRDVKGSEGATVSLSTSAGDFFQRTERAPFFQVQRGKAVVTGLGSPGTTVRVTFKGPSGAKRGVGRDRTVGANGLFRLVVRKNGKAVKLRVGDRAIATVAPDAKLTLPANLTLDISDAANDHLTGRCFPNQRVTFLVIHENGTISNARTADETGAFDATGIAGDAMVGSTLEVRCHTRKGDIVLRSVAVP